MGATAIVLGAFGAHTLKQYLNADQLTTFETGVKYQMYHALFLLFVATTQLVSDNVKKTICWLVTVGVVFFSGSIYLLSTVSISQINTKVLGPITPIGGLLMIVGWLLLFAKILGKKTE